MDKKISRRNFLKGLGAALVTATVPTKNEESQKSFSFWDYVREAYVDYWPQNLDVLLFQLYFEVGHYVHLFKAIETIFGIEIKIPTRANKD